MIDQTHGEFELLTADDGKKYMCCLYGIELDALGGGNIKFLVNGCIKTQYVQSIEQLLDDENCKNVDQLETQIANDVGEYVNDWLCQWSIALYGS